WRLVASVDTREKGSSAGGQHAVSITGPEGNLGEIRHLLFDISRTEDDDPFGNTFFSEIDVVAPDAPRVAATPYASEGATIVETEGSKHRIVIDTSDAPDLAEWATSELAPVVKEWYPKIIELLPSEGYTPAAKVTITFSSSMRGVAATGGTRITCAASWYRQNLRGEAKGSVVHELVHVVQAYGLARRRGRGATRTPGWLVEGIADYIRWFLYEPQSRGAEISRRALPRARYDASYRVSANFLSWVVEQHGAKVVRELNAAAREGRYTDALWKDLTGVALEDLGAAWKKALEKKLDAEEAAAREKAAAQ
ncbi:MAG: hypothetical protein JXA90_08520, partial [Planctomycetes bacterium]|nr:hypothetical protein [Planctomycetota bacterium]